MIKIVTVLGARPQFVKAAVLSRVLRKNEFIKEIIVHTGQHYDLNMSEVFFDEMNIPRPDYNLGIAGMTHGAMTGQMILKIEEVLENEKPAVVVVYGDTNSTLAGALAAKKMHIKLVHVEAGLRSFNMKMPEEINRILTDRISDLLLCPTETAIDNLEIEGFKSFDSHVVLCGDIMKDAVEYYSRFSEEKSTIIHDLNLEPESFVLATIHRQENTDSIEKLSEIFDALTTIHKDKRVVLPLHPRTKKILSEYKIDVEIDFIDPVGYFDMLELLKNCALVITDSGGLQKEAYFNKKCCVIVREETEWVELVEHGFAVIAGSEKEKILAAYESLLDNEKNYSLNLFGENVGEKMVQEILRLI